MTAALEDSEWSAARPGRTLLPGKDRVPTLQRAGWAPGPVWKGGKSPLHRDLIPDRPARSQSLYRLIYRAHGTLKYVLLLTCQLDTYLYVLSLQRITVKFLIHF